MSTYQNLKKAEQDYRDAVVHVEVMGSSISDSYMLDSVTNLNKARSEHFNSRTKNAELNQKTIHYYKDSEDKHHRNAHYIVDDGNVKPALVRLALLLIWLIITAALAIRFNDQIAFVDQYFKSNSTISTYAYIWSAVLISAALLWGKAQLKRT
jgi:hypothetical protein